MSELVLVAIVSGACNIAAVVIGRLLSHYEHKQTAADVREIKILVNGRHEK